MIEVGLYTATAILVLLCAALLWPFLACACCHCPASLRLPPRLLLLRLWLSLRLFFVAFAAACVGFFLRPLSDDFGGNLIVNGNIVVGEKIVVGANFAPTGRVDDVQTGLLAVVISFLLAALVFTKANRGRAPPR